MKTCTICDRPHWAKGYCTSHYWQWKTYGEVWAIGTKRHGGHAKEPVPCGYGPCDRPAMCGGYCNAHYQQQRRGRQLSPLGTTYGGGDRKRADKTQPKQRRQKQPAKVTPAGWDAKTEPKPKKPVSNGSSALHDFGPVSPTPPEILDQARALLQRHGAEDLAECLGLGTEDAA